MKKICLVGGEDVHKRIALSHYLTKADFKVTIIGTSTKTFPDTITYVPYNLVRHFSPSSDYKTLKWLQNFFKNNDFDVIHTFDTKPAFLLPLALKKNTTPITRTITGLGTIFMSKTVFSSALRMSYYFIHRHIKNRVYKTIFQNYDDRDLYLKHKLVIKPNYDLIFSSGIDLTQINKIAPRNHNKYTFICVARLVYEKGIINLLEAAKLCKDKGYDFNVLLVGPLEENSKRLNKTILDSYRDVVQCLGKRHDIYDLLLNADAFILPTFREGFARVLLEAAAVGLPIIATNVTGVREFAKHEKEALLVEVKNSKALSNAMIRLSQDKELADNLVENALKHVEKFSLEHISKQYINIFNQAINQEL
ncbi:glycosyltransferase [Mangrovimonas cancribranchiae]|uniref:Glycosyltransferase n=1 Tax=Mangrovimonas cancribranchiae TaxID=3080055 RepID=A0AAU6P061_9FLAO